MNILVLTSVYRDSLLGKRDLSTNIVNSFVYEWTKMGHNVIVIHNSHQYPIIIHKLPLFMRKMLSSFLNFQIPDYESIKEKKYNDQGATVIRIPIKKMLPHQSPNKRVIIKQKNRIMYYLNQIDFSPDVIIGHWASPQIELISLLREKYNCKTAVVLHGMGYITDKRYNTQQFLNSIDRFGCRSIFQANEVKKRLKLDYMPFVCYSGVPDSYISKFKLNVEKIENIKKWKIAFVGRLVAYKNVDVIIKALSKIKDINWELNIIGEGPEKNKLKKLVSKLKCENKVQFVGNISRDDVMNILGETNMFIMVSKNEVFGLSYLEAMAASCIVIASKNGGIDGIIIDSVNGFLCNQGDIEDLRKKLIYIFSMKEKEIKKIVNNSYNTVLQYTDSKVAELYLENVINDKKER